MVCLSKRVDQRSVEGFSMTIQDRTLFLRFEGVDQIDFNGRPVEALELKVILKRDCASTEDTTAGIIYQCGSSEFVLT